MEGLLIAQQLALLGPLPSSRASWRFPDEDTFVLPLGETSLWLFNRPPNPRLEVRRGAEPPPGRARSRFQELLVARAGGDLADARQLKLDRVVELEFAAGEGFVGTKPVRLIAELTGRNCNLILTDPAGVIIGAAREIRSDRNRFRQILPGLGYAPPPPYEKADPRTLGEEGLTRALGAGPLSGLGRRLDGIGPEIVRALASASGVDPSRPPGGEELVRLRDAFVDLLADPSEFLARTLERPDLQALRRQETRAGLAASAREALVKERDLLTKRLDDLQRSREAAAAAGELRAKADLLLARAAHLPPGQSRVALEGFDGRPVDIELDPGRGGAENAQEYFRRARKREQRARAAEEREPELRARLAEIDGRIEGLADLTDTELRRLVAELVPERPSEARRATGARFRGPHDFPVLVGRSSRENEAITFGIARSRDVWLHVQGYPGSHVLIQAGNREVPFDTILFAASLAAGHSRAAESDNVPVDYTLRKNVWRAKGQGPGAVHFSQHKTVYVTPSRRGDPERQ